MIKFLSTCFLFLVSLLFVNSKYVCHSVDNCTVFCDNIDHDKLNRLKFSEWIPVLRDNGNCYFHNKQTNKDTNNYPL